MAMTMTQKILAKHAGLDAVTAGQLIEAQVDLTLANDITGPVAIREMEKAGFDKVFDRTKIALVMDHFAPNKDIKSAQQCLECREFAKKYDIVNFYDVGEMGVEHALLPEKGLSSSSAQTPTPVPTVRWVRSPPALARPIWLPVWQPVRHGLRFPRRSSLF